MFELKVPIRSMDTGAIVHTIILYIDTSYKALCVEEYIHCFRAEAERRFDALNEAMIKGIVNKGYGGGSYFISSPDIYLDGLCTLQQVRDWLLM